MRVGLTGGIAAGKSVVASRLAEHGAAVIDHDLLAREVVGAGTPGLRAIVDTFGPEVRTADGALDRPALALLVFTDAAARARLDGVLHPLIRAAAREAEAAAVRGGAAVVVHDIPLLVETGQQDAFDVVVVVDAPVELRVQRLVQGRGLTDAAARSRIAAQVDDAVRVAAADVVLDGSGSVADLERQVDSLWSGWALRARTGRPADGAHGVDR